MMSGMGGCLFFQHDDGAGLRDKGASSSSALVMPKLSLSLGGF